MDAPALLDAIIAAFPERPLPEMTLRQAQLADQSLSRDISDQEWNAEGDRDRATTWRQIDDATLKECDAALCHIDEEGFAYYLPAYLALAVRHIADGSAGGSKVLFDVVFHLTNTSSNYALARLKHFTDRQIDVVIEFLRAVRDRGGFEAKSAGDALKSYWETPDAHRRTLIYVP